MLAYQDCPKDDALVANPDGKERHGIGHTTVADFVRPVFFDSIGTQSNLCCLNWVRHAGDVAQRNVLGGDLQPCGIDPMTGFYRNGDCSRGPEDLGSHTICAVVTAEFLQHQRGTGNDLSTPRPEYLFPGLVPGDRWCVTALNWARAYREGVAAPVVLAATNQAVLQLVPLAALQGHAVDVPGDASSLEG